MRARFRVLYAKLVQSQKLSRLMGTFACAAVLTGPTHSAVCPIPQLLGKSPTRLVVVVPGTGQDQLQWGSFLSALKNEPQSNSVAWLVFDHKIQFSSIGSAYSISTELASCVDEKVKANGYKSVTLIGHSIGGMLARRAYLEAAGAFPDKVASHDSWANKVDRILLLASVNKGIGPDADWWGIRASWLNWLLRNFPHPRFVLEDVALGSDFVADIRIAWIRHFGSLIQSHGNPTHSAAPHVVQFWGTEDSIVTERDNADLEAFNGPVLVRVSGATHGDLNRLDLRSTPDPASRWALFRHHLFDEIPPNASPPVYEPRRVLFIARGIRDSSNSEWVSDLRVRAAKFYGAANIEDIEYGYFSAAHFALRPQRAKNIPRFRDRYAQRLAENPRTEFDFIGHSNGTYIFGQSLMSTPSMRFGNVVLAAPVLPTDFNWTRLFDLQQVRALRYDTASGDWPVGILCPILRAFGFTDVGPSGVVLFGDGTLADSRLKKVGWYDGDHSAAIRSDLKNGIDNREHLLAFAINGSDVDSGEQLSSELGAMQQVSRATPYVVWTLLAFVVFKLIRKLFYDGRVFLSRRNVAYLLCTALATYVILDIV